MTSKQKLELTWIGKDARPKLEPRIFLEDPSKSYHAKHWVNEADSLKKIPKMVFTQSEVGHEDFSLNVANLPMAQPQPDTPPATGSRRSVRPGNAAQGGLFGGES